MNKNTVKYIRSFIVGVTAFTFMMLSMSGCSLYRSSTKSSKEPIYDNDSVTTGAEFPGGKAAFDKYLLDNYELSIYGYRRRPIDEGVGVYSFIVDKEGKIKKIKTVQAVSEKCDLEILRIIKNMPPWKPATLNGNPVSARVKIHINFIVPDKNYDKAPQFPGGTEALRNYLTTYSKYDYGRVYVKFIVDEEGNVKEPKIIGGGTYSAQSQALALVKGLPKWEPAMKNGKPIRTTRTVVVYFERY